MDDDLFSYTVGRELLRIRQERGLTHAQVVNRLPYPLSPLALRSYESATRACTVTRLHDLCCVLDVPVAELLATASARVGDPQARTGLWISVTVVTLSARPELRPLRAWAQRLGECLDHPRTVLLPSTAIRELAFLCAVEVGVMYAWLAEFSIHHTCEHPDGLRPGDVLRCPFDHHQE